MPGVVNHAIDTTSATQFPTTFGEPIQTFEIVSVQSHMLGVTS
jgi:hypothetical protein